MHEVQQKLLKLMDTQNISGFALRDIGKEINETGSPQKIKHHLDQLAKKGLIVIDKKKNKIKKVNAGVDDFGGLISLPILGSANCGVAACFAGNHIEGYLKVSKNILGNFFNKAKDLFVLRAVGSSMNRARVSGNSIEDGDYVIVDRESISPEDGSYVVSVIGGVANIKKMYKDKTNQQIVLVSESNQDLPPIYIHFQDLNDYMIAGQVIRVMKKPDELTSFRDAAASDTLKALGPMTKEEHDYYMNL